MQRISENVKEAMAEIFRGLKDPRVGFVTITDVVVTPDLDTARIFVSVLGDARQREETLEGLKSAEGYFRRELGQKVRLRKTPRVNFILDTGIERGVNVIKLIDQVTGKSSVKPDSGEEGALPALSPDGAEKL